MVNAIVLGHCDHSEASDGSGDGDVSCCRRWCGRRDVPAEWLRRCG